MSFMQPLLLGPTFFRLLSCGLMDYHLESGVMPLHGVVGVNCKKDATTENDGTAVDILYISMV